MLPMFAGRTGFDHPPTQAVRADSVLYDVGSGFGRFASFLRAHTNASRVVGIEVNSCRARQESGLYCSYGGVETLPEAAQGPGPSTAFFHCSRASRRLVEAARPMCQKPVSQLVAAPGTYGTGCRPRASHQSPGSSCGAATCGGSGLPTRRTCSLRRSAGARTYSARSSVGSRVRCRVSLP